MEREWRITEPPTRKQAKYKTRHDTFRIDEFMQDQLPSPAQLDKLEAHQSGVGCNSRLEKFSCVLQRYFYGFSGV
jgi:hypothetical protein